MPLWTRDRGRESKRELSEVLNDPATRVLSLEPTHVVVADLVERTNRLAKKFAGPGVVQYSGDSSPDLRELGVTGQTTWNRFVFEDYNPELRGYLGYRTFDKMRRSDGQVRATLRLVKTPVLAARWYMEAGGDRKKDQTIAEYVWDNLTKWMTVSWPQLLIETLLMLDFGWYAFEKVWDIRPDGKVYWRKFAPRHPLDMHEIHYDSNGGLEGIRYYAPEGSADSVFIPVRKLAVFSFDKEAGNVEGISVLRSAYKHWYMKENLYKIDAIQKERHGIGIPVIKLPPNFNETDKRLADEMGRNLRTNEKAHIVLPPNWSIEFAEIKGQQVNALESIEHHDLMIARNVLGQFINAATGTTQEEQQQLFLKATRFIADIVRDVFNKYCIPQLVMYNWGEQDSYPELKVRRIGDTVDWRTISFAIRNFVGSGIVVPDEQLEKWVRDEMDLPAAQVDTARIIVPPQQAGTIPDGQPDAQPGRGNGNPETNAPAPAAARLPRQSTAAGMRQGRTTPAIGRTTDRSGGN